MTRRADRSKSRVAMGEFRDASERTRDLLAASHARTEALRRLLLDSHRRVAESKALLVRAAGTSIMPYHDLVSLTPRAEEAATEDTPPRTFAAVTELIARVAEATGDDPAQTSRLVEEILHAIQNKADPCLLLGVLLEGVIQTVLERIPAIGWQDTAMALCGLLLERVGQAGAQSN
jgi:hypothetical protein